MLRKIICPYGSRRSENVSNQTYKNDVHDYSPVHVEEDLPEEDEYIGGVDSFLGEGDSNGKERSRGEESHGADEGIDPLEAMAEEPRETGAEADATDAGQTDDHAEDEGNAGQEKYFCCCF